MDFKFPKVRFKWQSLKIHIATVCAVCMCIQVFVGERVRSYKGQRTTVGVLPQALFFLFEAKSLLAWNSPSRPGWLMEGP